jgi:signal peptidase I
VARLIRWFAIALSVVLVVGFAVFEIEGHAYRIPSSSMEPTLHCARPGFGCEANASDRILAVKLLPWGRGDIVGFRLSAPAAAKCGAVGGAVFVKRVIGLAGETVAEAGGMFSIDGRPLSEPYIGQDRRDHEPRRVWHVPAASVFLVGDNRAQSCDSRVFGPVPRHDVTGKVFFRYWPLSRIGLP